MLFRGFRLLRRAFALIWLSMIFAMLIFAAAEIPTAIWQALLAYYFRFLREEEQVV